MNDQIKRADSGLFLALVLACSVATIAAAEEPTCMRTHHDIFVWGEAPKPADGDGMLVADLNNDGLSDVLECDEAGVDMQIAFQRADGTFGAGSYKLISPHSGCRNASQNMTALDIDQDGYQDVALIAIGGGVELYTNQEDAAGGRTLGSERRLFRNIGFGSITSQDLNADSYPDLILAGWGGNGVYIALNDLNGSFHQPVFYMAGPSGTYVSSISIANLVADSALDLVLAQFNSTSISILPGLGDGTFGAAFSLTMPKVIAAGQVAAADMNLDGAVDLVVQQCGDSTQQVDLVLNDGNDFANYQDNIVTIDNTTGCGWSLAVGDVNGDGDPDIAVTSEIPLSDVDYQLLHNDQNLSFRRESVSLPYNYPLWIQQMRFGEIAGRKAVFVLDFDTPSYASESTCLSADTNCDRILSSKDINPFVLALSSPAQYTANYPQCTLENADANGDGNVDLRDVNTFAALLSAAPEPSQPTPPKPDGEARPAEPPALDTKPAAPEQPGNLLKPKADPKSTVKNKKNKRHSASCAKKATHKARQACLRKHRSKN